MKERSDFPKGLGRKFDHKARHNPLPVLSAAELESAPLDAQSAVARVDYAYQYPAINDQGQEPSCVTFAVGDTLAFYHQRREKSGLAVAHRALYSDTKHLVETTDIALDGLYDTDALKVLEQTGYVVESDWPYYVNGQCDLLAEVPANLHKTDFLVQNARGLPATDYRTIRQALFAWGPVMIGVAFPDEWFTPNAQGFVDPNAQPVPNNGHEIVIVGANLLGQGELKVRNSWGTGWGASGYFYIPRDTKHLASIIWDAVVLQRT